MAMVSAQATTNSRLSMLPPERALRRLGQSVQRTRGRVERIPAMPVRTGMTACRGLVSPLSADDPNPHLSPEREPQGPRRAAILTCGHIMKFGVGQPVKRFENQTLITGRGRYTDDITLPNMVQAYVLRARVAHANIRKIDTSAAKAMPGVLLVLTGEDVKADGLGDVPCHAPLNNRDGSPR